VVLVAHHGSAGSSDPDFVATTGARHAVISSGFGNRFGHPRPQVVERWQGSGAQVHDTAGDGALRIRIQEGGIVVEARRRTHPRFWDAARR
jgi:competence protein ComEC